MKHLTISEKSVLLGDEAADLLASYTVALADAGRADSADLLVINTGESTPTGLTAVLDAGTQLVVESVQSDLPEPDNGKLVEYLLGRIGRIDRQRNPGPEAVSGEDVWNRLDVE